MPTGAGRAAEESMPAGKTRVVVIPIREQISKPELFILRRGLKEAIARGAHTVVLDMDTPGGALDVTFDMIKAIGRFPGKTITYVNSEAISAGALIAAATDEIHFAPDAVIGAAAPVLATGGEIDATMQSKIVSYLKARVRSISEGKGYRGQVISAMIDRDMEFKIGDEIIKPKGELLSLTAQEALKPYGTPPQALLGSGIEDSLDALLRKTGAPGATEVLRLEVTWSEKLAQYITSITPILIGLGILCLYIEFKTPGFGFFGIAGISLLAVVFLGQFAAGLSGHEPLLLCLLGIALVVVEIFFFPGSLVAGLTGAALILGSLVWAMADVWPGQPLTFSPGDLAAPVMEVLTGVAIATVLALILTRFLPKGGPLGRLVLQTAVGGAPTAGKPLGPETTGPAQRRPIVGETGFATTSLFPSGQVEIGGRTYEAKLPLGFAEAGTKVRVTGVSEFGLTVEVLP